jgi:hypothetical protein
LKLTERFTTLYEQICKELNVPLAPTCKNHEKAFGPTTFGTVLGVNFDSSSMTWSISAEKEANIQLLIDNFLNKNTCTLAEIQKLHSKLSDFALSCSFMLTFRHHLIDLLQKFDPINQKERKIINERLKEDLWVWKQAIAVSRLGLPLAETFDAPPLTKICFVSDAAGAALQWINGKWENVTTPEDRGVASVEHTDGTPLSLISLKWPKRLLTCQKSSTGKFFGSKSTTLETIGLLLPFITNPKKLCGKHVVLQVDNTAVIHAWNKKYSITDPETSLLIRTLSILEALLECKIYVIHLRHMSNKIAMIADSLSRKTTTSADLLEELQGVPWTAPSGSLVTWLKNPVMDWDLPLKIVKDVKSLLDNKR